MIMEINGQHSANYVNQAVSTQGKEMQAQKEGTDEKKPVSRDEYVRNENRTTEPIGIYRRAQDENGAPKILFDAPEETEGKAASPIRSDLSENAEKKDASKEAPDAPAKREEKCTANTDKVDREIQRLKEKKQQLERQIQAASGDEKKVQALEKQLAQVNLALSQKDNDMYRRQQTEFS